LNKKLHILFLNSWYPSRVLPNNGDFIQRHAEAVSLQHEVTSIHIITDPNCKQSIEIVKKEINGINTIIGYLKQTRNPILKGYLFFRAYKKVLQEVGLIDIVHLNVLYPFGIFALHLKWFRKKPFIISEHWTGYQRHSNNSVGLIQKFTSRTIAKNANYVCPVSKNLENSMVLNGLDGNYKVIPNVVDTEIFVPKENVNDCFTMLHVSSMVNAHKNVEGILNVVSKFKKNVPNFRLFLVGNNSNSYHSLITDLSLTQNVIVIDQIDHFRIAHYMQQSDIFILFSNYENLPCVILESFSCGLPVISTNVGGIAEYFPDNFGQLIPKNDKIALLKAITSYHNDDAKHSKIKMHKYVKSNFSPAIICNNFTELYNKSLTY
jgi:glycosyltransferase involved in cell wall biosynthesis